MTTDFTNFATLEVSSDTTAEYTMTQLAGLPVLVLAPATPDNKLYLNAALKRARTVKQGKNVNADTIAANRDSDRELFTQFVVKDWKGVKDANNKDVPFSKENVRDFLKAIPAWVFDEVREFASSPENFIQETDGDEELIKN